MQEKRIKSFLDGEIKINTLPKIVNLEPTNFCQFDCIMCSRKKIGNYGEMSLDFLEYILKQNEMIFKNQSIWFELAGEPLLHSKIGDFIKLSKKYIGKSKIITNGVLLKKKAEELIDSGLDEIVVSIDTLKYKDFQNIKKPKINFTINDLLKNIKYFIIKNKNRVKVSCQFINFGGFLDEKNIIHTLKNIGVKNLIIKELSNRCGKSSLYFEEKNDYACFLPWERIIITFDGKVGVCCHDLTTTLEMGNLKNNTILEIWNNDNFINLRKKHLLGDLKNTVCYNCSSKVIANNIHNYKNNEFKFINI